MGRKYPEARDGQWIRPKRRGWRMRCCDCGLVHRFNIHVEKRGDRTYVFLQAFRDERATAQVRRHKKPR
jgi:hypothetical protein